MSKTEREPTIINEQMPLNPEEVLRFIRGDTAQEISEMLQSITTEADRVTEFTEGLQQANIQTLAQVLEKLFNENEGLKRPEVIKKVHALRSPKHMHSPLLDACIAANIPAYLYGEAGSGKTTAAEIAASTRGLPSRSTTFTPTASDIKLLGYRDGNGKYNSTGFREIWEGGGIFMMDEIDNGNPNMVVVMNNALEKSEAEFPDGLVKRHENTRIVAGANTIGKGATAMYVGRSPLDAATLDRFAMIPWDIDPWLESLIINVKNPEPQEKIEIKEGGVPKRGEWLDEVRGFRDRAAVNGMKIIVSQRATINGVKLAREGVGMKWLSEMLIYRGMNDTDRKKLAG